MQLNELELAAIGVDGRVAEDLGELPEMVQGAVTATVGLYEAVGFSPPWVGYVAHAAGRAVGGGGFKSAPVEGSVEIAYFTEPALRGQGIATGIAQRLVTLAFGEPDLRQVTAQTLPEANASTRILEKLGFESVGTVVHPEDGAVWEWRLAARQAATVMTERLRLREFTADDVAYVLELVNEPPFLEFIGDKGVRNEEQAWDYLRQGAIPMYRQRGIGMLLAETHAGEPVGMCGLLQRDALPHPDLGYAFSQRHWGQGYAVEAGRAMLAHGWTVLGLDRVVAITDPANAASMRVLEKLGFANAGLRDVPGYDGPSQYFERGRP